MEIGSTVRPEPPRSRDGCSIERTGTPVPAELYHSEFSGVRLEVSRFGWKFVLIWMGHNCGMSSHNQEIESKFYVRRLADIVKTRLRAMGARCVAKCRAAWNTTCATMTPKPPMRCCANAVLRLRRFDDIRLTSGGPGQALAAALARTEIEPVVNDFENARLFLEGLGYQVVMIYEKYRALYAGRAPTLRWMNSLRAFRGNRSRTPGRHRCTGARWG